MISFRRFADIIGPRLHAVVRWLPFTFGGAVFCVSAGMATWFFGVQRSDFVLVVLGSMGLLMCIIGLLFTLGFGLLLWSRFKNLETTRFQFREGVEHQIDSSIVLRWWMPLIQVTSRWTTPRVQVKMENDQTYITPNRRGYWESIHRVVRVGDAFGICAIEFPSIQPCELTVLPKLVSHYLPPILQGLQSGGEQGNPFGKPYGDRIDIRNYAVGDPVRFILWKVYARTGQLVVRTPERSLEPVQRMLSYLIVDPADSACAALSLAVLESGFLGESWGFGVDGHNGVCTDVSSATDAVVVSGNSLVQGAEGLEDFLRIESEASSLLIFAPPVVGEWVERVVQAANKLPVTVCLVGLTPRKNSTLETLLFTPLEDEPSRMDTRHVMTVVRHLQEKGISVSIVLSDSGRLFTASEFAIQFVQKDVA